MMLGIDEFNILLVLDDIGGSKVSKGVVKNLEKFLRGIHIYDEKFLDLYDIRILNEEVIYIMFSKNDGYYFQITSDQIIFFRDYKESYNLILDDKEDSYLMLFRRSIYLYCIDNKLEPILYYPETEGEILCRYDGF